MLESSREIRVPKGGGLRPFSILGTVVVLLLAIGGGPLSATTHDAEISTLKSSAAAPGSVLFIPASAHVTGDLGTNWRTDLEMLNPGQSRATVTISLLKARQSNANPSQRTYDLDPGESLRYEDVLMSVFSFSGAAALRITNDSGMVAVTSRTYNLTNTGTFGQFVGGVLDHTAIQAGQEGRIIQLTHNRSLDAGFRTNIGFVNTTAGYITVSIAMYSANGSYLGTKSYEAFPYEFRQIDKIFQKVTGNDVADGYAVLTTPTAGGSFFAYAAVIDNRTSDPVYITAEIRSDGGTPPAPTPTPTSCATQSPTPTATPSPTPTATPSSDANIYPYHISGWSGPLVVSGTWNSRTSGGLSASGTTYFSGAVANYGPDDVTFPANSRQIGLYVDSIAIAYFAVEATFEAGTFIFFTDHAVNGISSGSHISSLVGDPDNLVAESDESDNAWSYTDTWSTKSFVAPSRVKRPSPQIRVAPIPGWSDSQDSWETTLSTTVEWHGKPPLKRGLYSGAPTKAVMIDEAIYIPAAAHAAGALDTNWRTDVQLHNPGAVRARVEIAMLVRDRPNTAPQTSNVTVTAGTSVRLEDVLFSSFSFNGAAALRITVLEGDIIATSRTYNLTSSGTYGQFAASVPGMTSFVAGERALLMQLSHSASTATGFRTNVGMVNISGSTIYLDLDFRNADGTSYGTKSYELRPYEFIQKDKIFRRVTSETVDDGYIIITSQSAGAQYLAYATVIDNQTADSIFIPALLIGSGCQ